MLCYLVCSMLYFAAMATAGKLIDRVNRLKNELRDAAQSPKVILHVHVNLCVSTFKALGHSI